MSETNILLTVKSHKSASLKLHSKKFWCYLQTEQFRCQNQKVRGDPRPIIVCPLMELTSETASEMKFHSLISCEGYTR